MCTDPGSVLRSFVEFGQPVEIGHVDQVDVAIPGDIGGEYHLIPSIREPRVHVKLLDFARRVVSAQHARSFVAFAGPFPEANDTPPIADDEVRVARVNVTRIARKIVFDVVCLIEPAMALKFGAIRVPAVVPHSLAVGVPVFVAHILTTFWRSDFPRLSR